MTREEAIKELNDHYDTTDEVWLDFPKLKEALDMAISSLSAEGEYIKKEDVIKVVQKYAVDEQDGSEEWRSRVNDYLCSVYQDVSDLPTYSFPDREKGEWIPVSERLPEEGKNVLFCDIDNDIMLGYHLTYAPATHFVEKGSWEDMKNVSAWMELPEPYKAESEEE